jgi:CrcB protein
MPKIFQLVIGGALGTLARYALAGAVHRIAGPEFPYGTLAVNLSGCLLLGFLTTMAEEKFVPGSGVRLLLMIGFCGAFTTFSTFIFETNGLIRDGQAMRAFINAAVSLTGGFLLFRLGIVLAEIF